MDSDLLFNISLTLNGIRDSLNASSGLKSAIPVISGLGGVALGFSLNALKDAVGKKKEKSNKLRCIKYEVSDIKNNAFEGIKNCMKFYDDYYVCDGDRVDFDMTVEAVTMCFDSLYPSIVTSLSDQQRDNLTKTYMHLSHAAENKRKLMVEMAEKKLSNSRKENYAMVLLNAYTYTYYSAECYLDNVKSGEISILSLAKRIGIETKAFDMAKQIEGEN